MKKKIIITTLILFIIFTTVVSANTLILNITSNSNNIKVGDNFKVTLDWQQKMQAADLFFSYDSKYLEFVGMDIGENFYKITPENIEISWFSLDNVDKTKFEIEFKAIKSGKTSLSTKTNDFADGNVITPDDYNEGNLELKIKSKGLPIYLWIILLVVIAIIIRIYIMKNRKK